MSAEVPQWLIQAFVRSVQAAGSADSKDQIADVCRALIGRWSSPDRSYHGVTHLTYVLTRLETLLPEAREPDLVRLAAWYHGCSFSTTEEDTYTHNGGENEDASATIAHEQLQGLGVAPEKAERVASLIRALGPQRNAAGSESAQVFDLDEQTLRDAHLGTLAVEPQRYKNYLSKVAEEYSHIPRIDFLTARRQIVSRLLSRKQLFLTPLARQWDEPARENLAAELERLNNSLAKEAEGDSREGDADEHVPAGSGVERTGAQAEQAGGQPEPAGAQPEPTSAHGEQTGTQAEQTRAEAEVTSAEGKQIGVQPEQARAEASAGIRREPRATNNEDTMSSLEACADRVDPGLKPHEPATPEAARKARRDQIAEEMRQRIEERHKAADTIRMNRISEETAREQGLKHESQDRDDVAGDPVDASTEEHSLPSREIGSSSSTPPRRISAWERVMDGQGGHSDRQDGHSKGQDGHSDRQDNGHGDRQDSGQDGHSAGHEPVTERETAPEPARYSEPAPHLETPPQPEPSDESALAEPEHSDEDSQAAPAPEEERQEAPTHGIEREPDL